MIYLCLYTSRIYKKQSCTLQKSDRFIHVQCSYICVVYMYVVHGVGSGWKGGDAKQSARGYVEMQWIFYPWTEEYLSTYVCYIYT